MEQQGYYDFVGRVEAIDLKIDRQLDKAERLRSLCDRVTTIWTADMKVQSSGGTKREERIAELIDSKRDLEILLEERNQVATEIMDFFNSVLKPIDADVLIMKYINRRSIQDIAELRYCTYSGAASRISRAEAKAREAYEAQARK